jgi:hypothetical protein
MLPHACNPSYSGGGERKEWGLRPGWPKSLQDPVSTNKNLGVGVHACHPSYGRQHKQEGGGPGQPRHKPKTQFEND